jgi:hypothetical protein
MGVMYLLPPSRYYRNVAALSSLGVPVALLGAIAFDEAWCASRTMGTNGCHLGRRVPAFSRRPERPQGIGADYMQYPAVSEQG